MSELPDEEFERQYTQALERGLDCGWKPSPLDFRIHDEHGTVLEVEVGKDRWIINICQQESRSSMFITNNANTLRKIRDALTRILEDESTLKGGNR